jgi:hypothetical protein
LHTEVSQFLPATSFYEGVGIVGIAQSVQRRATGWTTRVRFLVVKVFPFLHSVQTGSGAHPSSYSMGTGVKASWA